jgi:hypothetical protein
MNSENNLFLPSLEDVCYMNALINHRVYPEKSVDEWYIQLSKRMLRKVNGQYINKVENALSDYTQFSRQVREFPPEQYPKQYGLE